MSTNLRAYLVLFAVFALGAATGAGLMYAHGRHPFGHFGEGPRGRQHIERRVAALTRELQLSDEQAARIAAILERQREPQARLLRETMDRCGEPLRKLRQSVDAEIMATLRPEQQHQYEELLRSRDRRRGAPQ